FTYTANAGAAGTDTFTFVANDGVADSNVATVTVTLNPNNTPPTITAADLNVLPATVAEGGSVSLSGTFTDPDAGDTQTVMISWGDGSSNDTVNLAAGVLSFGPVAHTFLNNLPLGTPGGPSTLTVAVTDGASASSSATTSITVNNVAPVAAAGPDQAV